MATFKKSDTPGQVDRQTINFGTSALLTSEETKEAWKNLGVLPYCYTSYDDDYPWPKARVKNGKT